MIVMLGSCNRMTDLLVWRCCLIRICRGSGVGHVPPFPQCPTAPAPESTLGISAKSICGPANPQAAMRHPPLHILTVRGMRHHLHTIALCVVEVLSPMYDTHPRIPLQY